MALNDPFEVADNLQFNIFRHTKETRRSVLIVSLGALCIWMIQGFDSGIREYGTSLHWSVFVIYGSIYYLLSWYYDTRLGITGTRNFIYCFSFTIMAVGIFEWYWMAGYALVYEAPWIIKEDLAATIQNIGITLTGILCLAHIYRETNWRPRIDVYSVMFGYLTLPLMYGWIAIGFPQTVYHSIGGSITYVENDMVHLINTVVKISMALATILPLLFKTSNECEKRGGYDPILHSPGHD